MIKSNFSTYGQIIYDTKTNSVHSVEFLSRPKDGAAMDIELYFKNIDNASLMFWFNHQIGEAINFYRTTGVTPHVNIDFRTFEQVTESYAWEHKADDVSFTLEFTQIEGLPESNLIEELKNPSNFPTKWPWKGLHTALDDYDMNNVMHNNVEKYNFDIIKIDKSLVKIAETSNEVYNHLKKMVETRDCEFIVEGVENIYQLRMMQEMGFHLFQGYYFHKPEPLENLIKKL